MKQAPTANIATHTKSRLVILIFVWIQVVNQCGMSLKAHDDATIAWCQAHHVTYEAFDAMKGCDFSSSTIKGIAAKHGVGVAQVRAHFRLLVSLTTVVFMYYYSTVPLLVVLHNDHHWCLTPRSQVCLRWVLQRGAVMAVGTGSNPQTAGQYSAEDLDVFSFNLTAPEMTTLNAL